MGSVSRAASYLELSQPAISMQIQLLEQRMQYSLFNRARKGMQLTPAGELLFELARPLLQSFDQLYEQFHQKLKVQQGSALTYAADNLCLHSLLPAVLKDLRKIDGLHYQHVTASELMSSLADNRLQVIISAEPLSRSDSHYHEICVSPWRLLIAKDHPLATKTESTLAEIAKLPLLGLGAQEPLTLAWQRQLAQQGALFAPPLPNADLAQLKQLVALNQGPAVLPEIAISTADLQHCLSLAISDIGAALSIGLSTSFSLSELPSLSSLFLHFKKTPVENYSQH